MQICKVTDDPKWHLQKKSDHPEEEGNKRSAPGTTVLSAIAQELPGKAGHTWSGLKRCFLLRKTWELRSRVVDKRGTGSILIPARSVCHLYGPFPSYPQASCTLLPLCSS